MRYICLAHRESILNWSSCDCLLGGFVLRVNCTNGPWTYWGLISCLLIYIFSWQFIARVSKRWQIFLRLVNSRCKLLWKISLSGNLTNHDKMQQPLVQMTRLLIANFTSQACTDIWSTFFFPWMCTWLIIGLSCWWFKAKLFFFLLELSMNMLGYLDGIIFHFVQLEMILQALEYETGEFLF